MNDVSDAIAVSNRWETSRHLRILTASRFIESDFVRLVWNTLKDWRGGTLKESLLTDSEVSKVLDQILGVDPQSFFAARDLLTARGISAENFKQPQGLYPLEKVT